MLARKVAVRLKEKSVERFVTLMEGEILPWLREQEGFLDMVILASMDGKEVSTITFWDHCDDVPAYGSGECLGALRALQELLDGSPQVKTYEVVGSTMSGAASERPTRADNLFQHTDSSEFDYR